MVADCGATCARWMLCLSNFVFLLGSAALLAVGSWLAADKASFVSITLNVTHNPQSPASSLVDEDAQKIIEQFVEPIVIEQAAYILIALGAFIFVISFLGYCGAMRESRVLLTAYAIFILLIFLAQIALIFVYYFHKPQADKHSKDFLKETLNQYYTTGNKEDAVTRGWDLVMSQLSCCGVESYEDFRTAMKFVEAGRMEGLGRQIPEACCRLQDNKNSLLLIPEDRECIVDPNTENSFYLEGCYVRFHDLVASNLDLAIGAVVVVAAGQLLAIILSFCLCRAVGTERNYYYKY